jgi:hypothetical protein
VAKPAVAQEKGADLSGVVLRAVDLGKLVRAAKVVRDKTAIKRKKFIMGSPLL